ncbi:MAG: lipopolysaccharide biosynthesis regulator YciM [Porticoccus sp.]|jgi:lipopolysaccharide biosynthesis regulator YciM
MSAHNFQQVLKRYRLVPPQEPGRLSEVLERVRRCYHNLDDQNGLLKQLGVWIEMYPGTGA